MALWVWEINRLFLNQFVHFWVVVVSSIKRRESYDHFVGQNSDSPPVYRECVTLFMQYFRCKVVWCAAKRKSLCTIVKNLSQAEICKADIPIFIHQDVFWFQVTINNLLLVQVSDSHAYLNRVESSTIFCESLGITQVHEKFSTTNKTHYKKNLFWSLEDVTHANQKRMISLQKNIFLKFCWFNLVVFKNNILSQRLHRIDLLGSYFLNKEHFAEAAPTNNFFYLEILQSNSNVAFFSKSGTVCTRVLGHKLFIWFWTRCGQLANRTLRRLRNWLIQIFITEAILLRRHTLSARLNIFFGCCNIFKLAWHAIDRQVGIHKMKVASLELLKKLITSVTDKPIVIFILNMHNEFQIATLRALRECLHLWDLNAALKFWN